MSEQIITILLSTLLGGVLTISGGLVVNYVNHRQTYSDAQRKELCDAIEKIYKLTSDIEDVYLNAISHRGKLEEERKNYMFFKDTTHTITMLVDLYAPALAKATLTFRSTINADLLEGYYTKRIENDEYNKSILQIFKEIMDYRKTLAEFLHQKRK